jgi:pyridoxal phosphate enzyme (YggS family)
MDAYRAGERIFGESRVQELTAKQPQLPADIQWHFIGHLQTNKVKYLIPCVSLIHSVDSIELLVEINRQSAKNKKITDILLQVHIAREETKFGFLPSEILNFFKTDDWRKFMNVRICGLMGMATYTDDNAQIISEFQTLAELFKIIKTEYLSADNSFCELSMGMTDDFPLAIAAGGTMLRIGGAIFGERKIVV